MWNVLLIILIIFVPTYLPTIHKIIGVPTGNIELTKKLEIQVGTETLLKTENLFFYIEKF